MAVCYCSEQIIRQQKRRKNLHTFPAIHLIGNHLARRQPALVCRFLTAQHHKNTKYRFKHPKNTIIYLFLKRDIQSSASTDPKHTIQKMQIQTIQRISIHFAANSQKKPLNRISLTPQNRKLGHYTAPSTDNIVSTIPTTKKHSNKIKKRNPYPIKRLQQSIIISHRHLQIKSAHHHFTPASPRTSTSLQYKAELAIDP